MRGGLRIERMRQFLIPGIPFEVGRTLSHVYSYSYEARESMLDRTSSGNDGMLIKQYQRQESTGGEVASKHLGYDEGRR